MCTVWYFICIYMYYIHIYIQGYLKLYVISKIYVHGKTKNKMEKNQPDHLG